MGREKVTDKASKDDVDKLEHLGKAISSEFRCNLPAVQAGNFDLTFPSADTIKLFAKKKGALVVRVKAGEDIEGLGIFVADTKRGGGQLRWLVVPDGINYERVANEIIHAGVEEYGWAWGRVSNPAIHARLIEMGYTQAEDDPEILIAGTP